VREIYKLTHPLSFSKINNAFAIGQRAKGFQILFNRLTSDMQSKVENLTFDEELAGLGQRTNIVSDEDIL
jgi:hypothetical protein